MVKYTDADSIETVAPLSAAEARMAPDVSALAPGEGITRMADRAAEVGEYRECYWASNNLAFGVDVDGNIHMEFREIPLRYDTPGVEISEQYFIEDGTHKRKLIRDFTGARNVVRIKGFFRVDHILREFGFLEKGLACSEIQTARDRVALNNKVRDPKFLAYVAISNDVRYPANYRHTIYTRLMNAYRGYLESQDYSKDERRGSMDTFQKNCDAWVKAFDEADKLIEKYLAGDHACIEPNSSEPPKATSRRSRGSSKGE